MFQNTKTSRNLAKMLLVAVLFSTMSCSTEVKKEQSPNKIDRIGIGQIQVAEIDSCQYVIWSYGYAGGIVHKQNCKFCLARHAE